MVASPNLLHGNETGLYGDSAYTGQKEAFKQVASKAKNLTNKRACRNRPPTDAGKEINRMKLQVRTIVGQPFHTLKSMYGFAKARYRGLVKNANRAFALLALINLDKRGLPLTGQVRPA
jgi:IS5 family transposase